MKSSLLFAAFLALMAISIVKLNQNYPLPNDVSQFQQWKITFNKNYQSEAEQLYRLSVFAENLKNIKEHNRQTFKSYQKGVNQFTDLTQSQFAEKYLTPLMNQGNSLQIQASDSVQIPADQQINWVEKGYVTSIKNEGACGACWAFAALGPLQAKIKQDGKPLVSLSAQQLMDCSGSYGNYGCNGGWMVSSYQYISDKGVTTEDSYPYKGVNQKCIKDGGQYKVKGYVQAKDCNAVANALMSIPIAVAVDATSFYNYKSGVFSGCAAKPNLNHAFALVGMTSEYWLGKEQWGVSWGEKGYIRISKSGSACGICTLASFPI